MSFLSKFCVECSTDKPTTDFYKMANGNPARVCKECHKTRMKVNRLTNPDVQRRERDRAKTPERRSMIAANTKRWREENPEAYKAHNAVNNAVRDGKLTKLPCSICGTSSNVHGHHKDYDKPLDVTWLCARCHQRVHATFPELGGNYWQKPIPAPATTGR